MTGLAILCTLCKCAFYLLVCLTQLLISYTTFIHGGQRSMLRKKAKTGKAEIVCIQERHFKASSPKRLQHHNFPHVFLTSSEKKQAGVLIAIRDSISFQLSHSYIDPGGRFIILTCDINNVACTIVNVYVPNSHPISFLNKVKKKV